MAKIMKEFESRRFFDIIVRSFLQIYGDMEARELKNIKQLEEESRKHKRMYAELALEVDMTK